MKINVDDILPEGLDVAEKLDPRSMSLYLDSQGIDFTEPIEVRARFRKSGAEVFIDVSLKSSVEYTCSRCLTKFKKPFNEDFNINHEVKPGDVLDVDEDIRQEIIIDYPMKSVCKQDCKGLCQNCGQNLNAAECECGKDDRQQSKENRGLNL